MAYLYIRMHSVHHWFQEHLNANNSSLMLGSSFAKSVRIGDGNMTYNYRGKGGVPNEKMIPQFDMQHSRP